MSVAGIADPAWVAKILNKSSGEDHLGLRAPQAAMTGTLLPGITTVTPRARYYAFYSWVIDDYRQAHPPGWALKDFLRRREQLFVLATIVDAAQVQGAKPSVRGLAGWDKLVTHWEHHQQAVSIPLEDELVRDYLTATNGGFANYKGVLANLGAVRTAPDDDAVVEILPKGRQLSEAFAAAISATRYYQQRHALDTADAVASDLLLEYGRCASLDRLAGQPDCKPVQELLFAFDAAAQPAPHDEMTAALANMHGSLALILDLHRHTGQQLTEDDFRRHIAYSLTADYTECRPAPYLVPFVAHWQLFQLREYYVYAIYAAWSSFLLWLRDAGPAPLAVYDQVLGQLDLCAAASRLDLSLPTRNVHGWTLAALFDALLDAAAIPAGPQAERLATFSATSRLSFNEDATHRFLQDAGPAHPDYLAAAWLLLAVLYLRLSGLRHTLAATNPALWRWAATGDPKRRPFDHFLAAIGERAASGATLYATLRWFVRDYLVAQHTLVALEKWRARKLNTFHFTYDDRGLVYLTGDSAGYSAPRYDQARAMLTDLGLLAVNPPTDQTILTPAGSAILRRSEEVAHGRA